MATKRKTIHRLQEGMHYKVSVHPSMRRPAPHEVGYLVVIGEQLNHNGYVFVGWAPADDCGLADLLTLVQYGYPAPLVVQGFKAATPYQVGEIKKQLDGFQVRTDDDNWFENRGGVEHTLQHVIKSKQSIVELLEAYEDAADHRASGKPGEGVSLLSPGND
jgi:hypothetical protein